MMLHAFRDPFYEHGLTLIPATLSNHLPSEVCDKFLSIPKLQRLHRWSLGMAK